ncbi:MAG: hypothetical protein KAT39_08355 [Alphaproteobacteria bacterium]|nr:hypothetical protein [Alphaproteobacteria bacterium]
MANRIARPWLDPILLATLCGLAALALVALAGRIPGVATKPGNGKTVPNPDPARPNVVGRMTRCAG